MVKGDKMWARQGSNLRPIGYEPTALPLSYEPTGGEPSVINPILGVKAALRRRLTRNGGEAKVASI